MQEIISSLREHIKLAYQNAEECDAVISQLNESGMANFAAIFPESAGFETKANRFKPYVEEVAKLFLEIVDKGTDTSVDKAAVSKVTQLLEQIFATLQSFSQSMNGEEGEK